MDPWFNFSRPLRFLSLLGLIRIRTLLFQYSWKTSWLSENVNAVWKSCCSPRDAWFHSSRPLRFLILLRLIPIRTLLLQYSSKTSWLAENVNAIWKSCCPLGGSTISFLQTASFSLSVAIDTYKNALTQVSFENELVGWQRQRDLEILRTAAWIRDFIPPRRFFFSCCCDSQL